MPEIQLCADDGQAYLVLLGGEGRVPIKAAIRTTLHKMSDPGPVGDREWEAEIYYYVDVGDSRLYLGFIEVSQSRKKARYWPTWSEAVAFAVAAAVALGYKIDEVEERPKWAEDEKGFDEHDTKPEAKDLGPVEGRARPKPP